MNKISEKQQKLVDKLKELFMMDQADLDFGIYRIMNAKHDEIEAFLHKDLLPTIRKTLQAGGKSSDARQELETAIKNAQDLGMNPDDSPKVQELKQQLGDGVTNSLEKDEDEIFSNLTTFFNRYYEGGDFLSLRRYKQETYSPLPMNGEEVKLHWANADQYYIKSAESFSNYAFMVGEGSAKRTIRFELVEAGTEQNNKKESTDNERRFILDEDKPLSIRKVEQCDELIIHFNYQPDTEKRKQTDLNQRAFSFISELESDTSLTQHINDWQTWQSALVADDASYTVKNKKRTVLDKYINDYTAKNSFDYFIHKDLGGFLNRELNFFIKNELLLLDDIVPDTLDSLSSQLFSNERSLKKIVAFKTIAQKLIAFLAQLENFQKNLWLKKKFVLESNYCMTLDLVDESFYQDILGNDRQTQEWIDLGFIDQSVNVSPKYLRENPYLIIDTGWFDEGFKQRLIAVNEDLDEKTNGLLVHSENFQALNLLRKRYREQVKCVYIDPPYNTSASEILYKNNYKHSSWLSLINDRVELTLDYMSPDANFCAMIDDVELNEFCLVLDSLFGSNNQSGIVPIRINPSGRPSEAGFALTHEYALFYRKTNAGKISRVSRTKEQLSRFNEKDEEGIFEYRNLRREGSNSNREDGQRQYYPIYAKLEDGTIRVPTTEPVNGNGTQVGLV